MPQVGKLDYRVLLTAAVLGALVRVGSGAGAETAPDVAASHYFAAELVNDTRGYLSNLSIAPAAAARAGTILLQNASRLDGENVRTLKMLADTAHVAGKPTVEKEALRTLIGLDRGNAVALVQYLDLLAGGTEVLDERAHIYQSAYDQETLDPQVRSEMAVRLAQIAEERGETNRQREYLNRAVGLNSVNVVALRRLARLAAQDRETGHDPQAVPRHLAALVSLLTANPYQPDAWLELARICESANLHDRAAEALVTAFEQFQYQGISATGDMYLELAIEQAASGHRVEAYQIAGPLSKLPDAPLSALILAEILATGEVPGVDAAAATQPQKKVLAEKIHKLLAETVQSSASKPLHDQAAALSDAAGVELAILPSVDPEVAGWIDDYAKLVAPDDATLSRLRGWQAYRAGKADDARTIFAKAGEGDPMVQIGMARLLIDEKKTASAAPLLQDVWSAHPTGLLAVQLTETARRGEIELKDTLWTKQMRDIVSRISPTLVTAHHQPREFELISVNVKKAVVGIGEPVLLTVRMSNSAMKPLPTGPDGVAMTTVGLAAAVRAPEPVALGVFAIEDMQRVFRVEPQGIIEATIRVDQGRLADLFEADPSATFLASIMAATAPRQAPNGEIMPGLGGQLITIGDVQRAGIPIGPAALENLRKEVTTSGGEKRLVRIQAAGALIAASIAKKPGAIDVAAANLMQDALLPLTKSGDPLVRAALLRSLPPTRLGLDLEKALAQMSNDGDALVRIIWAGREGAIARSPGEMATEAMVTLETRAKEEKDEQVKEWLGLMLEAAKPAPSQPARQGTTQPATPN